MDKLIQFLDAFFDAEAEALDLYIHQPDIYKFNAKLEVMHSFVADDLKNYMGLIPLKESLPEADYKRYETFSKPVKRYLFRIDTYKTNDNRVIYKCITSLKNPKIWKKYGNCFLVEEINGQFKIIVLSTYFQEVDVYEWYFKIGDEKFSKIEEDKYYEGEDVCLLDEAALGNLLEIQRLLPPEDDADSMEEYNKNS